MKKIVFVALMCALTSISFGQSVATNFICNDCTGTSFDLFTELDAGKVIVLCWVMPCGSCVGPAMTTFNVVASYQLAYPGTVFFYLVDDVSNTNCTSLGSWANSYSISQSAYSMTFSNPAISMNDYGGAGMPKIVAIGGIDHKILYNSNNTVNAVALQEAIDSALPSSSGVQLLANDRGKVKISPNPARESASVSFQLSGSMVVTLDLYNSKGEWLENLFAGKLPRGENKVDLITDKYGPGLYLIKVNEGTRSSSAKFLKLQ